MKQNKQPKLSDFGFPDMTINTDVLKKRMEVINMTTLRESAKEYVSIETKNIADLKEVSTEMDIQTKTATKKDGETFSYNYIVVDGEEYRVPDIVRKQLKEQLEEKPDSTKFKVKKSGSGLGTEYVVIMLD